MVLKYRTYIAILLYCAVVLIGCPKTLHTIYGPLHETDTILLELLESDAIQRLKEIDQYGHLSFKSFSRYDHSIGVWFLLKKFGASHKEQIAGLLHDASHTVFSHVGDKVFKYAERKDSYQDKVHTWHLAQTDAKRILEKHGFSLHDIDHKNNTFHMLEGDLPDICIDRLEYNLRGGLVEGLVSQEEVTQMLNDVRYENGTFFFKTMHLAKKFAEIPLYLTEHVWGAHDWFFSHVFLAHALLQAVHLGLISLHDIHFSTDDAIRDVLYASNNHIIAKGLQYSTASRSLYHLGSKEDCNAHYVCKFRGVDPLVQCPDGTLKRLSSLNKNFKHYYTLVKDRMKRGHYFKIDDPTLLADDAYLEEVFAV